MEEKNKIYLKALGRFFLLWIVAGIVADLFFAALRLSRVAPLSGLIGFIAGILYALKKYKEEIKKLKTNEPKN
jgi:membrane associated rhomboid family serine protease